MPEVFAWLRGIPRREWLWVVRMRRKIEHLWLEMRRRTNALVLMEVKYEIQQRWTGWTSRWFQRALAVLLLGG